ncbi:MAG: ABC transporter ATP-binding protein [Acidobacteriota bacterium]|jgi:ABC-2 type transport system ATP-binding protein/lipopolysaccharide transport system ATP-binding protein|nr:ABC transporter ATP-binding protein [Acidobacteriota bacterium]
MHAIEARNIHKFYRRHTNRHKFMTLKSALVNRTLIQDLREHERFEALKGVDFEVASGKTLSIIGENGSGKSTLLKILSGISKPSLGEMITRGRISALIELGAGFHPEISGRENIFINGIILGLTKRKIQEKFDEIVAFAELEDFIDNPVKTYSSGMYMRLGFSIATHVDPEILLIDEVLAVGDASFVPKCLDKINEFRRKGKTIVFVSHDLDTVERISDEVIWLKDGRIRMQGYPKRVVDAYLEYIGKKDEKKAEERHQAEVEAVEETAAAGVEKRWGSGEVEISNVRMLDASGREKYIYEAGEGSEVVFEVTSRETQTDFAFGIGIFDAGGTCCYGTNTVIERFKARSLNGRGEVRVRIPRIELVNGTYFLDVAAHKRDGYPFDYHHLQYSFRVTSPHRDVGVVRLPHQWSFSGNIQLESGDSAFSGEDEDPGES